MILSTASGMAVTADLKGSGIGEASSTLASAVSAIFAALSVSAPMALIVESDSELVLHELVVGGTGGAWHGKRLASSPRFGSSPRKG